ncbi:MAG: MobA/MobL family protein (plasmid) [Candidatus Megaira endosymbiont of Mesostigma viride]|nr:MAG: MobA/MobL family protein [Candidatus Megaira endosymbiont of Mesostigma viride]HJK89011.1 MobA/MobL family protein [Candidatus Megaira endosymbiont of Mesostigma viride]
MTFLSAQVSTVKRRLGQNAVASAAYNARTKLELTVLDKATGITSTLIFDYSSKPGLAYSKIYAPDHAPEWVYDRQKLWNKCEQAENRCDANTAHKIMLPLPNELTIEQNIALLEDCVKELVKLGMIVDANIHYDNENNKHAHLMGSTRELVENRYGEIEFAATKNRAWNHKNFVNFVRQMHADKVNEHYAMHGYDKRFCPKSYKDLGIDLIPGVHEGPARSINNAELSELNLRIAAENAEKIKEKPSIILDVLTVNSPVFTKEQIAIELEKRLYAGVDFTRQTDIESIQNELSATFTSLYEQLLVCPEISQVTEADLKGRTLYTTTKRLELEERFIETVRTLNNRNNHALGIKDSDLDHLSFRERVEEKLREVKSDLVSVINEKTGIELEKPKQPVVLTAEQRKVVINVLNGSDISVLEGIPGAGKTTAMQEIVRQYKKAGYTVIGAAPSSSASLELAKATGIECKNASLWRKEWLTAQGKEFDLVLRGDYYKEDLYKDTGPSLTKKHVMIVDEASMVELANMDYLVSEARLGGAKILFVGDRNQLSPVGWAGGLEKTVSICGSEVLSQSRRQQNVNHQQATKLLSQYRIREALDIYWEEGVIKVAENESEANSMAVRSFVNSYIEKARAIERDDLISIRSKAITVFENKTREILNNQVREELKEAGILKGIEQRVLVGSTIKDGKKEKYYLNLCPGEQIVFTRNANRLGRGGIFNGEVGTILKISKPNEDGLSKIDILVHRANGKKEKVRLDLNELYKNKYTGKYFHDGIAIDYGYAITSHKVQGATIEDTIPRLEKNSGYEVTNVMLTRHKKEMTVIVSKEVLYDAFYESLDSTASKARNRFDLDSPEEETILKGGLAKMVSKRSNTSFASDYRTMGLLEEDKHIKHYLDKCEETITTIRKITSWQAIEQRKTGYKPQMWENKELWEEFKEARKERAHAASLIVSGFAENGKLAGLAKSDYEHLSFEEFNTNCKIASYAKFKDRLLQLNMNYATVEKHASQMVKASELDKVIVNQKATVLHDQDVFKQLVQAVAGGISGDVRSNYAQVNLHIAETSLAIEEKIEEVHGLEDHRQELNDAIRKEEHYRQILTPEYLNRIYRSSKGNQVAAGIKSLKLYEALIAEYGEEKATDMVVKNPTILGNLKGYGIGKLFGLTNDRKGAIALCKNLEKYLNGFNRSGEMVKQYKAQMEEAGFTDKLVALTEEIEHLRSLLPADIDNEFLKEVENKLQKSKGNNIDWRDLQKSELFEAVMANQSIKKESSIVANADKGAKEELSAPSKLEKNKELETVVSDIIIAEEITEKPELIKEYSTKQASQVSRTKQKSEQVQVPIGVTQGVEEPEVQVENVVITNADKSSSEGLSGSNRLEQDQGLKHIEQARIGKNKAEVVQETKGVVGAEELKKTEANLNPTPVKNNKPNKKQATTKEARLDFEDVKRAVNPLLVESIFRQYGQLLNPDGKMEKKGHQLFCGSLNINLKDGRWYRFSDGSKGDIFALVKEAAGVDTKGAFEIIAGHAGIGPKISAGLSSFKNPDLTALDKAKTEALQKEETWRVLDKIPENALAFKPEKDLASTLKKNNWRLGATYEYKNRDGELLGYVVRVLDKEGKKQTLPVSYCHNTKANINRWWLKGFSDKGYKPIYGAEKLGQSPLQRILIVEGEKAADVATKIFPEHTVISWMGGSAAASKANWKELAGREVTVWPDNDAAGEKAAKTIITEINKVNGFRGAASIVDIHALNLPEKWDLADELPAHLTRKDLAAAISNAKISENENRLDNELATQVRTLVSDKEFGDYVNYGVKRGKIDLGHDYLDLKNVLYREIITVSVASFMQENRNTKEALEIKEMLEKPVKNIPELAANILQIYESDRNSRNISNFAASRQTDPNNREPAELNPAKAKLYEELMQDFVWLIEKQQGPESLNKVHYDKLSQDLAAVIKGYNLSYKGSDKAMSDSDRKIIADNAYKLTSSKEWQEGLEKIELGLKKEVIYKTQEKLTILNRVKELALNKQKTDNPKDALIALKREQEYLAELHDKLNPNEHSKELMHNIKKAYEVDQSGAIAKLYKTAYYANQQKIISPEELTEHFKSNNPVDDIHHNINSICYKYHCDILNDHCKKLVAGQSVMHQGQQFDCVVEYLEHWKDNVNHDLLPIKKMDQVIEQVERIREQDHHLEL